MDGFVFIVELTEIGIIEIIIV